MQKLGSNSIRLRSYWSSFEALDELYPMGVVPGVFGSNSVRLRSYRYEKNPCKELYRIGRVCHFTVKECGGVRGGGSPSAGGTGGTRGHRPGGGGVARKSGKTLCFYTFLA